MPRLMPKRRLPTSRPPRASAPAEASVPAETGVASGVQSRQFLVPALALLAVTLIAYGPALHGALLWDDAGHVTKPELQSLGGLWRIWFDLGATQQYYPLLHTAFWIEHRIWGDHVLGYHLINITWHVTSAVIVAVLMRRWRLPGAWFAAAVFALHPVHVESVAWISEQKNTLSTMFYLLAGLAYLRFDERRTLGSYAWASVLFLSALASKTTTATLPAVLLVVMWWRYGRLNWRRDARPLVPWVVFGVAAGIFTAWVEHTFIGASGNGFDLNAIERVLMCGRAVWFYLLTLCWPFDLMFTYPRWTIDAGSLRQYLPPIGVVVVLAAFWLRRDISRAPLAGALVFIGTLVPVLGVVNVYPFLFSYVADHFQYVASLGVIVPAACGATVVITSRAGARTATIVGLIVVSTLGVLAWRQSHMYRDVETLYRETIARNPLSWMAHGNLGIELAKEPATLPEAVAHFEAAIRIRPEYVEGHRNLALAYWNANRLDDAIREYQTALRIEPTYGTDHMNLGRLLAARPGREAEATMHLETAVRLDPSLESAYYALGDLSARTRPDAAIAYYRAAVRLKPDHAEAHLNLANVLSIEPGRLDEAVAEYREAIRVRPNYPEAYFNIGSLLMDVPGRGAEATAAFDAAILLRPDYAEAHSNLGLALSEMPGRTAEAIAHLEQALRINPDLQQTQVLLRDLRRRGQ